MNIRNGIENSNLTRGATSLPQANQSVRSSTGASSALSSAVAAGNDQAHLSAVAAHLSQALPANGVSSDVRTALVQRVQGALVDGTYQVPASAVADKVMQSMFTHE